MKVYQNLNTKGLIAFITPDDNHRMLFILTRNLIYVLHCLLLNPNSVKFMFTLSLGAAAFMLLDLQCLFWICFYKEVVIS